MPRFLKAAANLGSEQAPPVRFLDTFEEGACFRVRQNKGVGLAGFILSTLNAPLKLFL